MRVEWPVVSVVCCRNRCMNLVAWAVCLVVHG